jgi:hypothetical protein
MSMPTNREAGWFPVGTLKGTPARSDAAPAGGAIKGCFMLRRHGVELPYPLTVGG